MKVALIEYKVRILPPDGDVQNGTMDDALGVTSGEAHSVPLATFIESRMHDYLKTYGLTKLGFTVTVEEIKE